MRSSFPRVPPGRAALIVGHPGHELRVHHWLEHARPVVFVLTDGSGHGASGRLASTTTVIDAAGATRGSVYGRFSDRQVYQALVDGRVGTWDALAAELADQLVQHDVRYVVADAAEGFNPTHDLCRYIADSAVARAREVLGRDVAVFEFDLDASPDATADVAVNVELTEDALERKLAAGLGYAEMRGEVEAMLARYGAAAFGHERFRPARSGRHHWSADGCPAYERFGRERLASGYYQTLITYAEHLAPVQDALQRPAGASAS